MTDKSIQEILNSRIIKPRDFKFNIDQNIKDTKKDMTIIDREYRIKIDKNGWREHRKWYKYHCNICSYEGWISEYKILQNVGCKGCYDKTITKNCMIEGCTNKHYAKGYCRKHYVKISRIINDK
jgi:hypothetical protein